MAYDPAPIRRDSVITQSAQEICRLIEAERLSPGDPLPTETRLAEMLGVSRNSVREALRVLHGLGYVEKAAGAARLSTGELADMEGSLASLEAAIARKDMNAAKAAHDAFHGAFLAGARNPLLVAMFNQAQGARLSNVSPKHNGFYDPRHLDQHRALLRALRKRDGRAARVAVRKHFQSLGLMLEVAARASRKAQPAVVVPLPRRAAR
jgi:DNA-binding FadR family transcriptional regulator